MLILSLIVIQAKAQEKEKEKHQHEVALMSIEIDNLSTQIKQLLDALQKSRDDADQLEEQNCTLRSSLLNTKKTQTVSS
jgi:hypothetical protein